MLQDRKQKINNNQASVKPAKGIIKSVTEEPAINDAAATDTVDTKIDSPAVESKPALSEVNPNTETVEGRLNELTSGDSKYVNLARNNAVRESNSRGLINSTIAAAAGEEKAIEAALPIAQQDASTYSDRSILNQSEQNKFNINQQSNDLSMEINQQSADLNMKVDEFRSELSKSEEQWAKDLQTKMELTLANEKLSNDVKMQYVQNIAQLTTDATNQITDIGLSDRTAEAQASAIDRIEKNRDAAIAVYEDLLKANSDWNWGTDFTPEKVTTAAEQNNWWNAPGNAKPINEPKVGDVINNQKYNGNGVWVPRFDNNNDWNDY